MTPEFCCCTNIGFIVSLLNIASPLLAMLIDGGCVGKAFTCVQDACKSFAVIVERYSEKTSGITTHFLYESCQGCLIETVPTQELRGLPS